MLFSLFPGFRSSQSNQISVLSGLVLGVALVLLMFNMPLHGGSTPSVSQKQGLFESLPPQVLEFSLGGASY